MSAWESSSQVSRFKCNSALNDEHIMTAFSPLLDFLATAIQNYSCFCDEIYFENYFDCVINTIKITLSLWH